jgi:hypothetical protein
MRFLHVESFPYIHRKCRPVPSHRETRAQTFVWENQANPRDGGRENKSATEVQGGAGSWSNCREVGLSKTDWHVLSVGVNRVPLADHMCAWTIDKAFTILGTDKMEGIFKYESQDQDHRPDLP